jgi:pimeloyl-ACP methyl ester carboxylesterase
VLHGVEDTVSPPQRSEGHMALFPSGTAHHVVAGAGHFMPREQPQAVVDALLTLLARTPAPSTRS